MHACRQSAVVGEYHPVRHGDAHVRDAVAVESIDVVVRDEVRVVVRHALQAGTALVGLSGGRHACNAGWPACLVGAPLLTCYV